MTISEERIQAIEKAHEIMKQRGWGFVSVGNPEPKGFGDPDTAMTGVGPHDGFLVNVLAFDPDPVEAVRKAVMKENEAIDAQIDTDIDFAIEEKHQEDADHD